MLSIETTKSLFATKHIQDTGTVEREKEEATYMLFLDVLYMRQKVQFCHSDAFQYLRNAQETRARECKSL